MTIAHHLPRNRIAAVGTTLLLGLYALSIQAQNSLTPGQFAVNDAGAATYSIPLAVAPGIGDLTPRLSLQYSSQAPNGVFGVGWTLSGVSSITRCAKNPAEEGDRVGVQNNATDVFCLDGQKLRAVNGLAYGAAGAQYRTAIDTYGRITSLGNVAGGPQSFTLETKSGEIYTFGGASSPGSWLEHPSKGVIRTWMVSEIKDRFNNRISFTYSKNLTLGEQLLTQVDYSNGQITLNYEARPANDQILKYDDGIQYGSTNSRVASITVAHKPVVSGTPTLTTFKTYQLQYSQSQASQRSMLRAIKECAPDGACLPAVSLAYRDGTPGVFSDAGPAPVLSSPNGLRDTEGNGKQSVYNFRKTYYEDITLWDVDGDGRTDILTQKLQNNDSSPPAQEVIQYGNGSETSRTWDYQNHTQCFADINGDGESEIISFVARDVGGSNSGTTVYSVSESSGNTSISLGMYSSQPTSCRSIDIDGDGRAEIFVDRVSGGPVNLTHKQGAFSMLPYTSELNYPSIKFGDFNGDGKTDWVRSSSFGTPAASTFLSSGSGLGGSTAWSTAVGGVACTGDFNGDGRTDILGGRNQLFLSNGISATPIASDKGNLSVVCGDFNGDGLMDVMGGGGYWYNALPADVDRLIMVNNGAGFVQEVSYKPITDSSVYAKGSGATYPQIDMQTPIMVVSQVKSGSAAQDWQNTSYRYSALRADLRRSGTQGFERVTSKNERTGVSVATYYNQNFPLTGLRSRVHKYVGSESAPQTLEDNTYGYLQRALGALPASQAAQVHLKQSTTTQYDLRQPGVKLGWVKESTDSFDVYGYPETQRTEHYDGAGLFTSSTTTGHFYSHQEPTWLLGQLIKTTTNAQNLRAAPSTTAPSNALTVQINPSTVQATLTTPGAWSTSVSATAAGGVGVYTFAWSSLGGTRVSIANGNTANPALTANLSWNEIINETIQVRVTDSAGSSVTKDISLRLVTPMPNVPPLSLLISPSSVQLNLVNPGVASASVIGSSSGGFGAHSYLWTRISGARTAISNPGISNPVFTASLGWGEAINEIYQLKVTDGLGSVVTQNATIKFTSSTQLSAVLQPPGDIVRDCFTASFPKGVVASGGVPPYSYQWVGSVSSPFYISFTPDNAASTAIAVRNLNSSPTVTVTVRDAVGHATVLSFSDRAYPFGCR